MDYLEKLKKEIAIKKNFENWQERRQQLLFKANHFYETRGENFIAELQQLLDKYESAPQLSSLQLFKNLTQCK